MYRCVSAVGFYTSVTALRVGSCDLILTLYFMIIVAVGNQIRLALLLILLTIFPPRHKFLVDWSTVPYNVQYVSVIL